jgi:hypothetical protein
MQTQMHRTSPVQHHRAWLFYFAVWSSCIAQGVWHFASAGGLAGAVYILVAGAAGLRPLFGYIMQRRYNPKWLWHFPLWIGVGSLVLGLLSFAFVIIGSTPSPAALRGLFYMLLGIPLIYALYQYLFRSPHLWNQRGA